MAGNEPTFDPFSDFRPRDTRGLRFVTETTFFGSMIVLKIILHLLNLRCVMQISM